MSETYQKRAQEFQQKWESCAICGKKFNWLMRILAPFIYDLDGSLWKVHYGCHPTPKFPFE